MKKIILLVVLATVFFGTAANATSFRDVPSNHFALDAIRWVSNPANGSYMVGDAANNFNPNRVPDVFDATISLAMAAGFAYSPASITPAMQVMFDRAFERHSPLINSLAATNASWRMSTNREIAFLVELGILTQADLQRFIRDNAPSPLTKEMATAFIMRLAGYDNNVSGQSSITFRDESQIAQMYRNYAYIAHMLGVVSDYDGYFNPQREVTRAEFAQMFYALEIVAPNAPGLPETNLVTVPQQLTSTSMPTPTQVEPISIAETESNPFYETMQGTITAITPTGVHITTAEGTGGFNFAANPVIVIDTVRRDRSYLEVGMLIAAGLNENRQILSMLAVTSNGTPAPTPTPTAPTFPTTPTTPIPSPTPTPTVPTQTTINGILERITLVNAVPVLQVRDTSGIYHNFSVLAGTTIVRNGIMGDWTDLRMGDGIMAVQSQNNLSSLTAVGTFSEVEGIIEELHITRNSNTILLAPNNAPDTTLLLELPPEVYDIYALRLGMELSLRLDSRSIYELEIAEESLLGISSGFIGTVQSLRHGHTMVVSLTDEGGNDARRTIRVDGNTINTVTGQIARFADLRLNTRLYIIMHENASTAASITILP
ncbi:MAG: S-layer homology domain-containing protein [Turicibacter sp.]|nr:S-layer homology domain-containing protein [Turicibacter sp.]